jgi:CubicO group peptidase (beta-lactamase class C family)
MKVQRQVLLVALLVWGFVLPGCTSGPDASTSNPDVTNSPLDPERLARVDEWLDSYVSGGLLPGAILIVLFDGQPVYERIVGWQDIEAQVPLSRGTLFRIASQSKAITTTAVLTLLEEGRIGLDDPVSRFLPEFATTKVWLEGSREPVPSRRPITIRDLFTHSSGISYGLEPHLASVYEAAGLGPGAALGGGYFADKTEPLCSIIERLAALPFAAHPGDTWLYGYSTDVLSCVAEVVTGEPLDQIIRERVTEPLGMHDTFFFVPDDKRDRLATVYTAGPDGKAVRAPDDANGQGHFVSGPRVSLSGGSGLVSTVDDYSRFLEMLRNQGALGSVRILSPRTVQLMTAGHLRPPVYPRPGRTFAFGFDEVETFGAFGLMSEGAYRWGGAYSTEYIVDPQARLTMLLLTQFTPQTTDIRPRFPQMVYQALVGDMAPQ